MMLKFESLTVLASLAGLAYSQRQIVNAQHPTPGQNSVTQYTSGPDAFDGPKVIPVNQTTFDWWYFDAVQEPGAAPMAANPPLLSLSIPPALMALTLLQVCFLVVRPPVII